MAQIILGVTIFSFIIIGYILMLMNKAMQDVKIGIILFLCVVLYLISLLFAVLGYYYMKTEVTKRALQAEVIIPVCVIGGLLLLLYVIWGAFGVWASGKTTFMEYLIWLFN